MAASFHPANREARSIAVFGVVQGVGFRPFVVRLAEEHDLTGWVLNDAAGVRMHVEGGPDELDAFLIALNTEAPPAAVISGVEVAPARVEAHASFTIRKSEGAAAATVPISVDLPVCGDCLSEMRDPAGRRFGYPYINCTNCGPRYTVVTRLPYDRPNTTMSAWEMCEPCEREYEDPRDRRYHAQPIACPVCGPHFVLEQADGSVRGDRRAIESAAGLLARGAIVAVKGLGGYHLACDARTEAAVGALRERKFRKDKPFAVMVRDLAEARRIAHLSDDDEILLSSPGRPIVLVPAREPWALVAPDQSRIGLMLPYTPLHHLLFDAGAPAALVMTSGNRSNEPIAFRDDDARRRLGGIADAILAGERPIARRADDSVATIAATGRSILRRARGYAPAVVARLKSAQPILAVGADLKNAITLVVDGQAIVSPHIGDLEHIECLDSFDEAVHDLLGMYGLKARDVIVAHDLHPEYRSTLRALQIDGRGHVAVQHHHAHIASVLAEHAADDGLVLGLALDGTGYGTDGTIWGGEFLVGNLRTPFERAGHLSPASLPGGDAAARYPALCALGFTRGHSVALSEPPFLFPQDAMLGTQLIERGVRTHRTTSAGRLFDAAAALCGFTGRVTFEGQAAMWLEHLAEGAVNADGYPMVFENRQLDANPLLAALIADRQNGRAPAEAARAFHQGLASGLIDAAAAIATAHGLTTVALSGGVWQNRFLLERVVPGLRSLGFAVLSNVAVPVNDGGISLGQAAIAASLAPGA